MRINRTVRGPLTLLLAAAVSCVVSWARPANACALDLILPADIAAYVEHGFLKPVRRIEGYLDSPAAHAPDPGRLADLAYTPPTLALQLYHDPAFDEVGHLLVSLTVSLFRSTDGAKGAYFAAHPDASRAVYDRIFPTLERLFERLCDREGVEASHLRDRVVACGDLAQRTFRVVERGSAGVPPSAR